MSFGFFLSFPPPLSLPVSSPQEEIAEMRRKMKTMNNQVTRLRDEITGKELALSKDQQEHRRLEKDNEALKVWQPASSVHSALWFGVPRHHLNKLCVTCWEINRLQLKINTLTHISV